MTKATWMAIGVWASMAACASDPPAGTVVAVGGEGPVTRLVANNEAVFWSEMAGQMPGVFRASLDAVDSPAGRVTDTPGVASWLTVDESAAYWATDSNLAGVSAIMKVPLAGGALRSLADGVTPPTGMAVDGSNLYWTDVAGLSSIPLTGGPGDDLAIDRFAQLLVLHNRHAYWSTGRAVRSFDLSTPGATPTTVAMTTVLAFGVDDDNVYWVTADANGAGVQPVTLLAAPLGGGTPQTLLQATADTNRAIQPIQVDDSGVYWCDGKTITRVGRDGTGAHAVATALEIDSFVLGSTDVYFAAVWDGGSQSLVHGIRKVPKD